MALLQVSVCAVRNVEDNMLLTKSYHPHLGERRERSTNKKEWVDLSLENEKNVKEDQKKY